MQQIPKQMLLTKHQPPALVNPQPVRESEIFRLVRFDESREGRGGRGKGGGTRIGASVGVGECGRGGLREAEVGDDFSGEGVEGEDALWEKESVSTKGEKEKEARRTGNGA
jgi:hypothetical protein